MLEKYKILMMVILLAIASYLTYYFNAVLRAGIIFIKNEMPTNDVSLRASMFIVISFLVGIFSEKITKSDELKNTNERLQQEITERRRAEEHIAQQRQILNNVFEALTDPLIVLDASDYSIFIANSAAHRGQLTARSKCYEITHAHDQPCLGNTCPLEEVKKTKKPATVEHIHYDKKGNARNVEVHCFPILDNKGNVIQMIEYCLDTTERRVSEKLRLENERLISANKSRSEFLTIMSHELRTPLTSVIGYSIILKEKKHGGGIVTISAGKEEGMVKGVISPFCCRFSSVSIRVAL